MVNKLLPAVGVVFANAKAPPAVLPQIVRLSARLAAQMHRFVHQRCLACDKLS